MPSARILNTTIAEIGPAQEIDYAFLRSDSPLRFSVDIADGDIIKIYGRGESRDDFNLLHTFEDATPCDIYPSREMKAERTTDGGNGESEVFVENNFLLELTEHE